MKKLASLTFIVLAVTIGCKSTKKQSSDNTKESDKSTDIIAKKTNEILFSITSTSCMGECPVFDFSFDSDSNAYLNAKKHLLISGVYKYKLSAEQYFQLSDLVNSVKWNAFENNYPTLAMDLPTNKFEVMLEDGYKVIKQDGLEPRSLITLKDDLVKMIESYDWQSK
ncbi:MAG: hypothetical protein GY816_06750 [Cytophagales bacterium]|nr:hypothetical protein [Cytophagales bacterium]